MTAIQTQNINMSTIVDDIQKSIGSYIERVVHDLSKTYNFDFHEAMSSLNLKDTLHVEHSLSFENNRSDSQPHSVQSLPKKDEELEAIDASTAIQVKIDQKSDEIQLTDECSGSSHDEGDEGDEGESFESSEDSSDSNDIKIVPYPKTAYPLPYTGVLYDSCHGIKLQHNLFVQCTSKPIKNASHHLCKTCFNQSKKNTHGKPNCGLIQDRLNVGFMEFKDPRGKKPKAFVDVLKSLKIEPSEVKKEFKEKNIHIPDVLWETSGNKKKKQKPDIVDITSSSEDDQVQKNDNKNIPEEKIHKDVNINDDIEEDDDNDDDDDDEDVDIEVENVTYNDVQYFQSDDNVLYDIETKQRVGVYCKSKNGVLFD